MATITRKRLSSFDEQRATRLAETTAAMSAEVDADRAERAERLAKLSTPKREFHSRPDAIEIPAAEIGNVTPLTEDEISEVAGLFKTLEYDEPWGDNWTQNDMRWGLTPHAAQKVTKRKRLAAAMANLLSRK